MWGKKRIFANLISHLPDMTKRCDDSRRDSYQHYAGGVWTPLSIEHITRVILNLTIMKKILFLAFVSAAMLLTASCKKEVDLTGTNWGYSNTTAMEFDGNQMSLSVDASLAFKTESTGKMSAHFVSTTNGETEMDETVDTDFTYTFDGESSGIITPTGSGDAEATETLNFTYNAENETITASIVVEGQTMTFTFEKQ